ncbi:MAG: hypothetical protein J7647_18315 [Cyanobacteria bacterium SBLK]|nr:hypothetical protein [Cyanobacteria bacterium SBLK]
MKRRIFKRLQGIIAIAILTLAMMGRPAIANAATPVNLIKNGSFELGSGAASADWTSQGEPSIGRYITNGANGAGYRPIFPTHDGIYTAVFNGGGTPARGVLSQSFSTVPGTRYDLIFYTLENGINRAARSKVRVVVSSPGDPNFLVDRLIESTTTTWQKSTFSFIAKDATTILAFGDGSSGNLSGTDIIVDDVSVIVSATQPASCPNAIGRTLLDFNAAGPLNAAPHPISKDGVTVSFKALTFIETESTLIGFVSGSKGEFEPNQVRPSDRANFNGRFLTTPNKPGVPLSLTYRRAIDFSRPVNKVCFFIADIDYGQRIKVNVLNAKGESFYSFAFPSSTSSDYALIPFDLSKLNGIKTIEIIGEDPIGIDNLSFVVPPKPPEPIRPKPDKCDPNKPIPGAFSSIRIGDLDGFGFGNGKGLTAASGNSVNTDGKGILSTGDFLPDFNGDGKFSSRGAGDPFDNRSDAEVAGTFLTGFGYEDMGSTGSDYTDLFLGRAFGKKGSSTFGRPFPDGDPKTLPNQPGFKFRFKVVKDKLPEGTPLFLNTMLGDYDVKPVRVILKKANGKMVTQEVKVSAKGKSDGQIQASFIRLKFEQVFVDGDTVGEPGYWVGSLDVDFDAPREPSASFDFSEIGTNKIPLQPCK